MQLKRVFTGIWVVIIAALLLITTVAGFSDASENIPLVDTALQKLTLVFQFLYSVSGGLALIGLLTRQPWHTWALGIWAVSVTITATLAPPAWGNTGIGPALAGGAGTALVTGMILWWTRRIVVRSH